jgi:hypothetical protein
MEQNSGSGSNPFREPDENGVDFPIVRPHRLDNEPAPAAETQRKLRHGAPARHTAKPSRTRRPARTAHPADGPDTGLDEHRSLRDLLNEPGAEIDDEDELDDEAYGVFPRRSGFNPLKLVIPLILVIVLATVGILISKLFTREEEEPAVTTIETTTTEATTAPTAAPRQLVTIGEGKNYNLRSSPDVTNDPVGSATAGQVYEVKATVTGAETSFGSTWYEIDFEGQTAYLIADEAGQTLDTE